jgi:hypothetical protein
MNALATSPIRLPQQWEWDIMQRYAEAAVKSGMVNGTTRPDQALFVILKGYELGITPIEALSNIHLIKGKPGLSVQLMISLANRSGMLTRLDIPDASDAARDKKATVTAVRRDRPDSPVTMTFSMEDAQAAGLLSNPTWKQYPGQMLVNRAISMLLRRIIPEALSGMYLIEELEASSFDEPPAPHVASTPAPQLPAPDPHWSDDPKLVRACYKWALDIFGIEREEIDEYMGHCGLTLHDLSRDAFKGLTLAYVARYDADEIARLGEEKQMSSVAISEALTFVPSEDWANNVTAPNEAMTDKAS